jgi:hypothetical protein
MRRLLLIVTWGLLTSCGVVGAPVAPETIGVAPVIERQQLQQEALDGRSPADPGDVGPDESDPIPQAQDEELLPLRPVGTR